MMKRESVSERMVSLLILFNNVPPRCNHQLFIPDQPDHRIMISLTLVYDLAGYSDRLLIEMQLYGRDRGCEK